MKNLLNEINILVKEADKKVFLVIVTSLFLLTISWYFTSRMFFTRNFYYEYFEEEYIADFFKLIYWNLGDTLVLFILPLFISKYFNLKDIGLKVKVAPEYYRFVLYSLLFIIPATFIFSFESNFQNVYPLYKHYNSYPFLFFLYQLGMLLYMFSWEFFFRGFMLHGLKENFGVNAIFIQSIPFVLLHNGKPFIETISSIPGGIILGILSYLSGSFVPGFIIHFLLMFLMDIFSIVNSY